MRIQSLRELSYLIRRQLKITLNQKNNIYNDNNVISLIKNIIPEVNNYSGNDWELYKYLINFHEHRFSKDHSKNDNYKFHYLYNNFYIEKKYSNYIKIQLPFTEKDDLFNMYLIKWLPNAYTDPHIHPLGGCIIKPLEGELKECIYDFKQIKNNIITTFKNKKKIIKQNNYDNKNILTMNYIDNNIGSHTIYNNINKPSYSLHIYGKNILEPKLQSLNYKNDKNNDDDNEIYKDEENKREHSIIKFFPL